MILAGKFQVLEERSGTVPLCAPEIRHRFVWDRII